tara:strand:- start:220 stop:537 length:318 start_codon:yes stop_codon:yes gene_type:complete
VTPEAQSIAIAEACGWIWHGDALWPKDPNNFYWKKGHLNYKILPDYLNDLNACHEMEKVLTSEQVTSYVYSLESMNERWSTPAFATASQRAEAFLRTIGKWEEDK